MLDENTFRDILKEAYKNGDEVIDYQEFEEISMKFVDGQGVFELNCLLGFEVEGWSFGLDLGS